MVPSDYQNLLALFRRACTTPPTVEELPPVPPTVLNQFSERFYDVHPNRLTRWLEETECQGYRVDGVTLYVWGATEEYLVHLFTLTHIYLALLPPSSEESAPTVYMALSDTKRTLPPHPSQNGGLSVSGLTDRGKGYIICTKRQDCLRLYLHELSHYYRVDRYLAGEWQGPIRTDRPVYLNEVWSEYVSVYLHALYYSLLTGESLETVWEREVDWNYSVLHTLAEYWETNLEDLWQGRTKVNPPIPILEYVFYRYPLLLQRMPISTSSGLDSPSTLPIQWDGTPRPTPKGYQKGDVSYSGVSLL